MNFKGVIIEESLRDQGILKKMKILGVEVEEVAPTVSLIFPRILRIGRDRKPYDLDWREKN